MGRECRQGQNVDGTDVEGQREMDRGTEQRDVSHCFLNQTETPTV